jgi:hypothetical protein
MRRISIAMVAQQRQARLGCKQESFERLLAPSSAW